ncbi:MAG: TrkA C-terminal domain-containing protein [Nitrospirota bacterium]
MATALQEIALRTDRTVQFAKLRLDQWEIARDLTLTYRSLGRRLAELVSPEAAAPAVAEDPELQRLLGAVTRLRLRLDAMTQQVASLHLAEPEQAAFSVRRQLRAAGLVEMSVAIPRRALHGGRRLAELSTQGEWIAIAVIRRGAPFVPDGSTTLLPGDELLLFGPAIACEQAKLMLEQPEPAPGAPVP